MCGEGSSGKHDDNVHWGRCAVFDVERNRRRERVRDALHSASKSLRRSRVGQVVAVSKQTTFDLVQCLSLFLGDETSCWAVEVLDQLVDARLGVSECSRRWKTCANVLIFGDWDRAFHNLILSGVIGTGVVVGMHDERRFVVLFVMILVMILRRYERLRVR